MPEVAQNLAGRECQQERAAGLPEGIGGDPGDSIGPSNPADVYGEAIPPQYNKDTTLQQDVKSSGSKTFNFELKSK